MSQHILNDISTITKIPAKVFTSLTNLANLCIGSEIADAKVQGQEAIILDIGVGTLSVDLTTMQCKFVPSKDLKASIKLACSTDTDPLAFEFEQALTDKLITVCEEVI